jgi:glycine/D-amino acid oxidase-like deaminating enzyme
MRANAHIVVVGAGFAGAAAAFHLARAGARVTLVERERVPGAHASSQNAGMLRTAIADPVVVAIAVAGAGGAAEVETLAEHSFLHRSGALLTGAGRSLDGLRAAEPVLRALGRALEWIDPADAVRRAPPLAGGSLDAALWVPGDAVADTGTYLAALLAGARAAGAVTRFGAELLEADVAGREGPVRVVTAKGTIEADVVVVAPGAWADPIAGRLGLPPFGIRPFRRHLHVTPPIASADPSWPFVWSVGEEAYFRPESGGLLLSPCDEEAWAPGEPPADPANRELLFARVSRAFPKLADVPIMRSWAGLRSFAPDRRFVLGRDPLAPRVVWAAGLAGHGVTTAWETGRIVADVVLERAAPPAGVAAARLRAPGGPA